MKATAKERREVLRGKWAHRLFAVPIASSEVQGVMSSHTYILTPDRGSLHFPKIPGVVHLPGKAYFNWTLCDAGAAFFEKHPSAKWLIIALISTQKKGPKSVTERARIITWQE